MSNAPKSIIDYYDTTAADWANRWYTDDSMAPLLTQFMSLLPSSPRVLDLCCGAGYESMRLSRLGAQVTGLDLSTQSIRIAQERNPELTFHVGDMLADYRALGSFDGLVCIAGLVHVPDAQLPFAFRHMAEALLPGSPVLLVVRDGEGRLSQQSDIEVNGVRYDRAFYAHTQKALERAADGLFTFLRELRDQEPSPWRNYIFQRI